MRKTIATIEAEYQSRILTLETDKQHLADQNARLRSTLIQVNHTAQKLGAALQTAHRMINIAIDPDLPKEGRVMTKDQNP